MAQELAPRLQLTQIIRTVLIFFSVSALINAHTSIGPFASFSHVSACFVVSWIAVSWNIVAVVSAAVHPYLQRVADGLPFPVNVTVRGRAVLSYGDSEQNGDGLMAPLAGKIVFALLDLVLATLLIVFSSLARGLEVECRELHCLGRTFHIRSWIINAWLTVAISEYVLAVVQGFEGFGLWYNSRYLKKRGQISLA